MSTPTLRRIALLRRQLGSGVGPMVTALDDLGVAWPDLPESSGSTARSDALTGLDEVLAIVRTDSLVLRGAVRELGAILADVDQARETADDRLSMIEGEYLRRFQVAANLPDPVAAINRLERDTLPLVDRVNDEFQQVVAAAPRRINTVVQVISQTSRRHVTVKGQRWLDVTLTGIGFEQTTTGRRWFEVERHLYIPAPSSTTLPEAYTTSLEQKTLTENVAGFAPLNRVVPTSEKRIHGEFDSWGQLKVGTTSANMYGSSDRVEPLSGTGYLGFDYATVFTDGFRPWGESSTGPSTMTVFLTDDGPADLAPYSWETTETRPFRPDDRTQDALAPMRQKIAGLERDLAAAPDLLPSRLLGLVRNYPDILGHIDDRFTNRIPADLGQGMRVTPTPPVVAPSSGAGWGWLRFLFQGFGGGRH